MSRFIASLPRFSFGRKWMSVGHQEMMGLASLPRLPVLPLPSLSSALWSRSLISAQVDDAGPPPAAFCCITSESSSLSRLAPECALLHSESFDVSGNSWLREIWWKVLRPVFTPSQMALNKLGGEDTNTLFSEGLNLEDCFGRFRCCMVVLGTFQT